MKLALTLHLIEKYELWDLLVGNGAVLHRAQVHDLPVHEEVALLIHIIFAVLIAADLSSESQVLKGCLYCRVLSKIEQFPLLLASLPLQLNRCGPCGRGFGLSLVVDGYVD